MKLQTSILPRADGTVIVEADGGRAFTFKPDDSGELTADVDCEATVARLLAGGHFFPADPSDFDAALSLSKTQTSADEDSPPADDDEDPIDPNALPIEANTPPVPARAGKKPKRADE